MEMMLVAWFDPVTTSGWLEPKEESLEPALCHTLGFKIKEDDKYLFLALSYSDGEVNGTICIPKCIIKSRSRLGIHKIEEVHGSKAQHLTRDR